MQAKSPFKMFELTSDLWQESIDNKDFHAAIAAGISAYIFLRQSGVENLVNGALNLIHVAIDANYRSHLNPSCAEACSFCGKSGQDVRLGAGSNAFICSDCAAIMNDVLNHPDRET